MLVNKESLVERIEKNEVDKIAGFLGLGLYGEELSIDLPINDEEEKSTYPVPINTLIQSRIL